MENSIERYTDIYPNFNASVWSNYAKIKAGENKCSNCGKHVNIGKRFFTCNNVLSIKKNTNKYELCQINFCVDCITITFKKNIVLDEKNNKLLKCPICVEFGSEFPDIIEENNIRRFQRRISSSMSEGDGYICMSPDERTAFDIVKRKYRHGSDN